MKCYVMKAADGVTVAIERRGGNRMFIVLFMRPNIQQVRLLRQDIHQRDIQQPNLVIQHNPGNGREFYQIKKIFFIDILGLRTFVFIVVFLEVSIES